MSAAARRPSSLCLFCQARRFSLTQYRSRVGTSTRRYLETVAVRPADDGFFLEPAKDQKSLAVAAKHEALVPPREYQATAIELSEASSELAAFCKGRDGRLHTLRHLSNPYPDPPSGRQRATKSPQSWYGEGLVTKSKLRAHLRSAAKVSQWKVVRSILRMELLECDRPREVLRVVAIAMQNIGIAQNLAQLYEPLMRSLYRCRANASDPEVLKTLSTIISRFQIANLPIEPNLLFMALKFAARARSLPKMKKFLKMIRESGLVMTSNVYRSVIAKFSIGHRGLGEIRNGRWRRSELRQVLLGFDDDKELPKDQQYHFGSFLVRDDWQYLHGWVAVLARCKESDLVWEEWLLWKQTDAFKKPKLLVINEFRDITCERATPMTNALRGAYWFLEQITYAGDLPKAWTILKETGIPFRTLKPRVAEKLLDAIEHATVWSEDVRAALLARYDRDLGKIERAFGVQWIAGAEDGEGRHELFMDQEEALERLGEEGWKLDEDYGYPWDAIPLVPILEKPLHDAEESCAAR